MSTHRLTGLLVGGHKWCSLTLGYPPRSRLPMDGVIDVCSIRGAVAGGVQLDVRRWDLQGAVAGGAAAELETWSLASCSLSETAVCPGPLSQ